MNAGNALSLLIGAAVDGELGPHGTDVEWLIEEFQKRTTMLRKLAAAAAFHLGDDGSDDPFPYRIDELCERLKERTTHCHNHSWASEEGSSGFSYMYCTKCGKIVD